MLLRFSRICTSLLLLLFSANIFANLAEKSDNSKEFDVNEMIMHHIKDSHEFHIMDINGHAVSFPLPIILWTDNGLVTFLSSEFNHDDSGKVIVNRKNQAFIKYHEKIFYAAQTGEKNIIYDSNGVVLNKKPLDLSITKMVFSMFISMVLLVLIFVATARTYSQSRNGEPTGLGKFTEPLVLFIKDEVALPMIGEKNYQKYMPF